MTTLIHLLKTNNGTQFNKFQKYKNLKIWTTNLLIKVITSKNQEILRFDTSSFFE